MEQELKKEILEQIKNDTKGFDSICIFINRSRFNVDLKDPKLISEIKEMLLEETQQDWVFSGKNLETLSFDKVEQTSVVEKQVKEILQNLEKYVEVDSENDDDEISFVVHLDDDYSSQELAEIDYEISSDLVEYIQSDKLATGYYLGERLDEHSSETDKIFYRFKVEKEE